MRLLTAALLLCACASTDPDDPAHRARELARRLLIVDGHIDVPYRLHGQAPAQREDVGEKTAGGDFDHPRAVAGGLDAPFLSIYTPSELEERGESRAVADELIDLVEGIVRAHPDRFMLARTAFEVRAAAGARKIAFLLGMENGSPIEGDLANLEHFYRRGVRYVTLCHGKDNHICDSSYDTRHTHSGLSLFGRLVVRRMNELGILVDVSHVSDDAFWQALEITRAPVIASHSSLRHFVPGFERNLSDEMVRALAGNGGVVMINFGSSFLTAAANEYYERRERALAALRTTMAEGSEAYRASVARWELENPFPRASVRDVADHIDRVVRLAGVDHVGFGSDFDGVGDSLPAGLEDVSKYPNLIAELLRRGYSDGAIEKICGGNALRVLEQCERVAREMSGR
jgi:membrane dipeptidase